MIEFLVVACAFAVSGLLFTFWERLRPRQPITYRGLIRYDVAAMLIVFVLSALAEIISHPMKNVIESFSVVELTEIKSALSLSFWMRLILFYVVWDFTLYWIHRLMHRPLFWPTHRWHHSPQTLWWLSGIRASLFHILLFQIAFFWFWLFHLPHWVYLVLLAELVVRNGWMHLNVNLPGDKWMEYLIVTPRYHAIHHADRPQWYNRNLGSLLTLWDRLFGTYINPDQIDGDLKFGFKDTPSRLRMILGID